MRTSTITFNERGRVAQYISRLPRKPIEATVDIDAIYGTSSYGYQGYFAILLFVMNVISENKFTSQMLVLSIYLDLYLMWIYIYI